MGYERVGAGPGPGRGDRPAAAWRFLQERPRQTRLLGRAKTVQTSRPGPACTATSKLPFFIVDKT